MAADLRSPIISDQEHQSRHRLLLGSSPMTIGLPVDPIPHRTVECRRTQRSALEVLRPRLGQRSSWEVLSTIERLSPCFLEGERGAII